MFVLKNAWTAMTHHKTRTILVVLIAAAVSAGSMFALSARYSYESATGSIYQSLAPDAKISVDRQKVMVSKNVSDASQVNWNDYNLSWADWSNYAEALSNAGVSFTPQYDETAVVPAAEGQIQPVNGSNFTVTGFYDAGSSQDGPLGAYTIVEGADLTYDESGMGNAIIPKALADKNGTKVGDTITLANPSDSSKTITFTVSGIYRTTAAGVTPSLGNDLDPDNAIYASYYGFSNVGLSPTDDTAKTNALNVTFKLESLDAYEQFKTVVKQAGLSDDYTVSSPKIASYNANIQPLKDLGGKLTPALIALWVTGGVLAVLLIAWTLAGRSEEIGYDIAVGVSRGRIGWQFALELILPALVGVTAGYLGAGFRTAPIIARLTTEVHGTPLPSLIWQCIWAALGAMVLIAVICWIRTALYRTESLFAPRPEATPADAAKEA
ncbi:ABC transporter permease [Bifidobacterium avesanii]|uniref:FtsX-like permease family protein n=1 Tax=Bifidobacterium avesanii TaxID=1798157 RepID=A0A7K3THZ8_9BIFI|nr:ABC transporter permease [Bifidobacterium avesanii]KAB8287394.1 ABC transporter permease [Bifidobacterium avesanii]NEG78691.1 FtsX-like permease family protein [Bifidobacterium avesanii]